MAQFQRRQFAGHRGFQLARRGVARLGKFLRRRRDRPRAPRQRLGFGVFHPAAAGRPALPAWPEIRQHSRGRLSGVTAYLRASARRANSRSSLRSSAPASAVEPRQQAVEFAPRFFGQRESLLQRGFAPAPRPCALLRSAATVSSAPRPARFRAAFARQAIRWRRQSLPRCARRSSAARVRRPAFPLRPLPARNRTIRRPRRAQNRHSRCGLGGAAPCRSASALARRSKSANSAATVCASSSRPPKRVQQPAMGGDIEQAAIVALAMDFQQQAAQIVQQPHAHRLVIDEGAGAAVGCEGPAQHDLAVAGMACSRQQRARRHGRDCGSNMAVAEPWAAPARTDRAAARRPPPGPRHRAGWICRRRSRRSAR